MNHERFGERLELRHRRENVEPNSTTVRPGFRRQGHDGISSDDSASLIERSSSADDSSNHQPRGHVMGLLDALLGHAGEKPIEKIADEFTPLLAPDESLQHAFSTVRDLIVFTDRRVILVNKQGVTAKKTEYRSIPYRAITMFSLETAGHFDLEAELRIWLSGQPAPIELHLGRGSEPQKIVALLAQHSPK
jgi:Bacterial PH domain